MWVQIFNLFIGLLLIIIPGIADFAKTASDTNHILGPLVLACAVISFWQCNRSVRFFNILTGVCLILAAIIFGFHGDALWLDLLFGVLLILFSLIKGKVNQEFDGGWSSLFR